MTEVAITHEPAPAGSLNSGRSRVEFLLESLERSESLNDGVLEGSIVQNATVTFLLRSRRREVLPEKRVVDVS
jgi:hypothetical protein